MPTMNISLTDDLKDVVEKRMADGRYSSVSEYVRELIRADEIRARTPVIIDPDYYHLLTDEQRKRAEDKLEALILEGLEGEPIEADEHFWNDFKARAKARREARRKDGFITI